MTKKFRVKFFENKIQVFNLFEEKIQKNAKIGAKIAKFKEKLVAQKTVWKTFEQIFTSLTFDDKNIYLKVVNAGGDATDCEFDLDANLFFAKTKRVQGKMTTMTEHPYDETCANTSFVPFKFSSNKFVQTFAPKSINVLTIKR